MVSSTELIISGSIAIIYPFFFHKLLDYATRDPRLNINCWGNAGLFATGESAKDAQACRDMQKPLRDNQDFIMSMSLLAIGIITIALSGFVGTPSTKLGLGLAGLFCIIYAIGSYWDRYQEPMKLIILGLSLLVLFMLSIRMYNLENISDIFVPDYGKINM